jgi:hypothetical protein
MEYQNPVDLFHMEQVDRVFLFKGENIMAGGAKSSVNQVWPKPITPAHKWLFDNDGTIVGVQNPSGSGKDFMPLPLLVTQAEIDSPTDAMIADTTATYQLNVAPYNRYRSNGTNIIGLDSQDYTYLQFGYALYGTLTVESPDVLVVQSPGELRVFENWPANP